MNSVLTIVEKGKLILRCLGCGKAYAPPAVRCPECSDPLLRSEYANKGFTPDDRPGIFRFTDWLPPVGAVDTEIGPVVYRSERLADRLGLSRLYISFNGYAPSLGALNMTGSFKDFEGIPTILYMREHGFKSVILASAGNTARAFAYAGTILDFPVYIVAPAAMTYHIWLPIKPSEEVRLIVVEESNDYALAIELASLISERFGIPPEGGVRNVARRDGMGTVVLEYARRVGGLPSHYFQAVGSGTGGVAAWEASLRLRESGRIADPLPKLHLVQNAPFTPIHDAWTRGIPIRPDVDVKDQLSRVARVEADVLANRNPPYGIPGGVRSALSDTSGYTYAVTNEEIRRWGEVFTELEGVPTGPEGAAAIAALDEALREGRVGPDEAVLLNITGNEDTLLKRDYTIHRLRPWLTIRPEGVSPEGIERLAPYFSDAGLGSD